MVGGKEDHAPKTNLEPEKSCLEVRNILFQTAMFRFHVSFQRTMYTYMYYTILTIYYILSSWERCRFKGMCWKKSFKVHRGVLIAKCGQNADHLGILDPQTVQITRRWHGLLRKMGHASRFVENDKILMAMFSFYFVVARKNHISPWFLMFFSRYCFMFQAFRSFLNSYWW